jgi:8-oxo-dGTP pyrophosphatase MutT (NUDIX family)
MAVKYGTFPLSMTLLSLTSLYRGRVIELNLERVQLPNGRAADLEIIHHPGGAAIVAIDAQHRVCLLRQFRHAANGWIWELPAGKIDQREPPLETAQRELAEEAGTTAQCWESLGDYLSSPGVFTEVIHLFLATQLEAVPTRHEDHEVLEVHWLPFDAALAMARSGELRDGKSLAGIFRSAAKM